MDRKRDEEIIQRLKDVFEAAFPPVSEGDYPEEALPLGTYVRSIRHKRLGIITDAFYGELDKDNQKIIIYTILLFPKTDLLTKDSPDEKLYITNEYEYEIIAYLMISPANLPKLTKHLGGELFL
jgi:hypothetical protein